MNNPLLYLVSHYKTLFILYGIVFCIFWILGRLIEINILRNTAHFVPRFIRAIYARKLHITGNISYKKNYHTSGSLLNGEIIVKIPFITSFLYAEPYLALIFVYAYSNTPEQVGVFPLLMAGLILLVWLFDLFRIVIPGLLVGRYRQ